MCGLNGKGLRHYCTRWALFVLLILNGLIRGVSTEIASPAGTEIIDLFTFLT